MDKIYIAGCGGMLGEAFYNQLRYKYQLKCTDIDLNEDWLSYLDFRDYDAYRQDVIGYGTDVLIHLGAYTDLEFCELNPDDTYITNTLSVENAVNIANEINIPLVYISTAGIFDGNKQLYDDWDIPNPLGVYGRTKYMGELYVKENSLKYLICRAGWMMGGGPNKDKKFINKIIKLLKKGNKELFIVNDKDGTPTYTHDFAINTALLLENKLWGLYNMVCEGQTSRFEVASELVSILGMNDEVIMHEVNSDYFKEEYFAVRPVSERLINKKLNLRKLNKMRNWKIALKDYMLSDFQGYFDQQ